MVRGELDQSIEFLQLLLFLVLYDSAVREDLLVGTRAFQEGGVTRDLRSPGFQTLFWVHFTWGSEISWLLSPFTVKQLCHCPRRRRFSTQFSCRDLGG